MLMQMSSTSLNFRSNYSLFQDPDDLPFEKGAILTLIRKDEEQWWTAMNSDGQKGLVPVPYIEKVVT
jgi:SH3 domain